ncbi:hypothetical protein HGQ17_14650 [Nesterenkonia sp. MY13]|uniref:Uncharacterized protein n=1 Tax=Nesterenkonia sedimenti TaxID=1463632 RepID=A0A7X8YF25_9MICC|nr:hypothetical protein [Nesterenkonia sedimenti]NLS11214.1 hypothetical protein [Nesterenkonia sedimenti]
MRLHREESGQTTVLILGLTAIILMLTAAIVSATSVNLQTRQLLADADGAASAAAASAQLAGPSPELSDQQVRAAAEEHLQEVAADQRHHNLRITTATGTADGQTVEVELAAEAELPVLRWVLPATVEVTAGSHARVGVER